MLVNDRENFYPFDSEFGAKDGFMVAAAITAFDGSSEDITDLSYGRLKFVMKSWDSTDLENG